MTIKICAGCDYPTNEYEDYGSFVLCTACDEELLERQEEKETDETYARMVCGHRNVWEFSSIME